VTRGAGFAARRASIVHHVPGRLRIRVTGAQNEADFFEAVQQVIRGLSGVKSVRVNPAASSIVVGYSAADTVFHLRLLQNSGVRSWLDLGEGDEIRWALGDSAPAAGRYMGKHSRLAETIVSTAEDLDAGLRTASGGYLDLKVLLPLGVGVASSLHKSRHRGTPMWMTLGTFAFNAFVALHRRRIDAPTVSISPAPLRRV
jgi:hypothetical protein